jgi:hypothetical protein
MSTSSAADERLSDRLPRDWKRRRAKYSAASAAHYMRVLRKLVALDCMSQDECERAAYVIVEKEGFRRLGVVIDDDDSQ